MTKKIITIEGMHCMHCASSVEKTVAELEGVKAAKVNLAKKTCTAKLTIYIDDVAITDAIKAAGFEVTDILTKKTLF